MKKMYVFLLTILTLSSVYAQIEDGDAGPGNSFEVATLKTYKDPRLKEVSMKKIFSNLEVAICGEDLHYATVRGEIMNALTKLGRAHALFKSDNDKKKMVEAKMNFDSLEGYFDGLMRAPKEKKTEVTNALCANLQNLLNL